MVRWQILFAVKMLRFFFTKYISILFEMNLSLKFFFYFDYKEVLKVGKLLDQVWNQNLKLVRWKNLFRVEI